ncbi:ABC-type Fe3+-hydroxamate transport system, periplasmic component [Streptomyces laurentii]|uniref:ABC-type Fe3+-hydroxamate transport system, periplasmic component n=1 Tax=Streptomyces laurentii TaxID=39478 RepID=A0A160P9P7_STRLU|nr:ABC-type Fe3+-hydroxamate transport system, periplasmic component [Streptomyces laurentii]
MRSGLAAAALLLVGALSACTGAPAADKPAEAAGSGRRAPVSVSSCGVTTTVAAPPSRLVTLNQGATEVALALGLQNRMAGTAYLDDAVPAKWKAAYEAVPVLSKEYPAKEKLLAARPDFLYASYSSAFTDKVAGTRADLSSQGIESYLSPFGCADSKQVPPASFQAVWDELGDIAKVFGVEPRAAAIQKDQKQELSELAAKAAGKGLNVLWYDSGTKTPLVGAGHGGPQLVLDAVGAHNIFGTLPGGWKSVSWERVAAADPDAIVLADASWDTAQAKIDYLDHDPVLRKLSAVRNRAFVVVPFSESTPGVLLAGGAARVSAGLGKLHPRS